MELGCDHRQIREDVGVIVFEVIQNRCFGVIVNKLAALVEECGVIIIGFNHEERRCCRIGLTQQPGRYAEIHRHTTDQETRIVAGVFQSPGQHR